jgi:hypothetical protein
MALARRPISGRACFCRVARSAASLALTSAAVVAQRCFASSIANRLESQIEKSGVGVTSGVMSNQRWLSWLANRRVDRRYSIHSVADMRAARLATVRGFNNFYVGAKYLPLLGGASMLPTTSTLKNA